MNYLDIALVLPLIYLSWKGFKKGIIIEIFTLLALFVGIYGAIHFADKTAEWLTDNVNEVPYLPIVSFVITFLIVGALVYFGGKALEKVIKLVALSGLNKASGAVFGLVKGVMIISVVLVVLDSIDDKNEFMAGELRDESLLYDPILNTSISIYPSINDSKLYMKNFNEAKELLPEDFSKN
jgi:membrane protein required for colicin V production